MLVQAWRSFTYPQIWSSWPKFVQNLAVISFILLFQILVRTCKIHQNSCTSPNRVIQSSTVSLWKDLQLGVGFILKFVADIPE
jgi:hypothetical protein